jgi:tetratricopeptide (TPR) repeat protein
VYETGILVNLGVSSASLGQTTEALAWYEQSLELARKTGSLSSAIPAQMNIGVLLHTRLGDLDKARFHYLQTISQSRSLELPEWLASGLCNLGQLERQLGEDPHQIESRLRESAAIFERILHAIWSVRGAVQLGHLELSQGRSARPWLEQARSLVEQSELAPGSEVKLRIAELERAIAAFEAGRPLFRGQCIEDYPIAMRRWFVEHGHLSAAAAQLDGAG